MPSAASATPDGEVPGVCPLASAVAGLKRGSGELEDGTQARGQPFQRFLLPLGHGLLECRPRHVALPVGLDRGMRGERDEGGYEIDAEADTRVGCREARGQQRILRLEFA